jgi:hypothetical protein
VFVFTLLVTGILVARRVRGGILVGLVAGTLVAVVIEAIWHLGANLVTGVLFLAAMFVAPLASMVPIEVSRGGVGDRGLLGGPTGRTHRGGHAVFLLDRQRVRRRLHRVGRRAHGGWIESLTGL